MKRPRLRWLVVASLVGMSFPAMAQSKSAKKKATPTAVQPTPTPTPAVPPLCRPENKVVRRAALDLKIALRDIPSYNLERWWRGVDNAAERLKAEASMADVDSAGVKRTLALLFDGAYKTLSFERAMAEIRAAGGQVPDNMKAIYDAQDASKAVLDLILNECN